MEVMRIGAISPPDSQRSQWARDGLAEALERKLSPVAVPVHEVVSFTATMNPALSSQLKAMAESNNVPLSRITAGLLEALRLQVAIAEPKAVKAERLDGSPGSTEVREELLPLLAQCIEGIEKGKIAFAEAATGTGKGRMIAALAAKAVARGDTVVISAPLAVTWQLIKALAAIPEAESAGITMSLGRPNFVSPTRLMEWATENEHEAINKWLLHGGKPIIERTQEASKVIDHELCWMLDDALSMADDLPVDAIMLSGDDPDDCPAQQLYKAMRSNHTEAGIILCSHYMLASHVRFLQMRGMAGEADAAEQDQAFFALPAFIDTLIVDEAHQLEQAFAAIYSHTLRLRPLMRTIESDATKGKVEAVAALKALSAQIAHTIQAKNKLQGKEDRSYAFALDEVPELEPYLRECLSSIKEVAFKKRDGQSRTTIAVATRAIDDALSGYSRLRVELSPVKHYPMLISGRANLQKAFMSLWDSVAGAALVSATLYGHDDKASLTRWKLEVPPARALYLAQVHPTWTIAPVILHRARNTIAPDKETPEWADECAASVASIAGAAKGGTLVLCTSFLNADMLKERLFPILGDRLIVQSKSNSAAMCVGQYKALHQECRRPVWLGLGAAWTGIDLSDESVIDPAEDTMLTDLVITRLPVGLNRSLTHERRLSIAGFSVVSLEGVWQLRQGLGRLVRRPGVRNKNLWVLDARLDSSAPWVSSFKKVLSRYASG